MENCFARQGLAAGIDEAGRGCLAGPVVAGAVILPSGHGISGLADSKALSAVKRLKLLEQIKGNALAFAVGLAWPRTIDRINILQATFLAMGRAVRALKIRPGSLLIDGNHVIPQTYLNFGNGELRALKQEAFVKGDAEIEAVSAASILAKTFRDALLIKLDARYPGYGLAVHKGYGTREHLRALEELGPSRLHRMTFKGVAKIPEAGLQGELPRQKT